MDSYGATQCFPEVFISFNFTIKFVLQEDLYSMMCLTNMKQFVSSKIIVKAVALN